MRKTFFALAAALLLAACAEKAPEKGALILGELTGFNPQDSIVVRLVKYTGRAGRGIARDTLQNGHFSLRLDSLYNDADFYSLHINEIRNHHYYTVSYGLDLYLEPGVTVRIKGDGWYIRTARVDSPVRDQILRESFMKKMSLADWQAFQKNSTLHNRIVEEVYEYKDNPWTRAQIDSLKALDKKILEEDKNIHNRIARQELKLLQTEEIGAFALRTLNSLAGEVVHNGKKEYREPVLRLYDRLTEEQKNSPYGIEILSCLNPVKEVFVGSPAPDVEYVDMTGKTVRLSDLREKWICWISGKETAHPAAWPSPNSERSAGNSRRRSPSSASAWTRSPSGSRRRKNTVSSGTTGETRKPCPAASAPMAPKQSPRSSSFHRRGISNTSVSATRRACCTASWR